MARTELGPSFPGPVIAGVPLISRHIDPIAQLTASLAGRYEIEREIGAGGMATVYLARDVRHNRRVALKLLKPELGAVLGVERFLAEIQVTAALQHPNLLPLFDSGKAPTRRVQSSAPEDRMATAVGPVAE